MSFFGDKDPDQFGYLQGTRTQNTFITEPANAEEKIISPKCLILKKGGVLLMSKLPK